jgi:hypothetical protein
MLDIRPICGGRFRPFAANPVESWMRFCEQYAVHRDGHTPIDLYRPDHDWEFRLHNLMDVPFSSKIGVGILGLCGLTL